MSRFFRFIRQTFVTHYHLRTKSNTTKKFEYLARRTGYVVVPGSICFISFTRQKTSNTNTSNSTKTKTMSEEQNLEILLQNADQLFDENHFQEVYNELSKYSDQSLSDINWRKARALFQLSKSVKDKDERNKLIRQSYDLIKDALEKNDNDFAIHKWMSIILDAYAELDGIKSRIQQLENVSHHMKRAIELNPNDPTNWYLMGAFEFGLADLPWIQRKIVSAIFATPPTGTYDKALEYFKKAENIKEGFFSMNWLMMGKCYYALKDYENAKIYFEKAANCTVLNEDDKNCKEEAQKLLKKV